MGVEGAVLVVRLERFFLSPPQRDFVAELRRWCSSSDVEDCWGMQEG